MVKFCDFAALMSVLPVNFVLAVTVDAGVAEALVDLGEAGGILVAVQTNAGETIDFVDAGATVVAGIDGTLVDVDVTHRTWSQKETVVKTTLRTHRSTYLHL